MHQCPVSCHTVISKSIGRIKSSATASTSSQKKNKQKVQKVLVAYSELMKSVYDRTVYTLLMFILTSNGGTAINEITSRSLTSLLTDRNLLAIAHFNELKSLCCYLYWRTCLWVHICAHFTCLLSTY